MRLAAIFLLAHLCGGAVVDGVVVEDETGHPLAWAQASLVPLPGTKARAATSRGARNGKFSFTDVAAGSYILRTSRDGFVDNEVGGMRPGRPGIPFDISTGGHRFFQIRMLRKGAIGGAVLDRNNVGIPDWPVQIMTVRRPVRRVAAGVTDDRGIFRIGLLEAGTYLVRSGGGTPEDGFPLVPSYYPYGTTADSAGQVRVRVGETNSEVVIHAVRGRLMEISGTFSSPVAAKLTLITENGRVGISSLNPPATSVPFDVKYLSPGPVELMVEGSECGGDIALTLERDMTGLRPVCGPLASPRVEWKSGGSFPLMIRRVDLDRTGATVPLGDGERFLPGRYEIMPQTGEDAWVQAVVGASDDNGWFGFVLLHSETIGISTAPHPPSLAGNVSSTGAPAAGAMVYLEKIDFSSTNRAPQRWTQRADAEGHYRFGGLTPGSYKVLASFDFDPDDRRPVNEAPVLELREGDQATQSLELIFP